MVHFVFWLVLTLVNLLRMVFWWLRYWFFPQPSAAPALTPEAWATLVGAFIATGGVLLGLLIQRKLERREQQQELQSKTRAVSRALLFEIDGFYVAYLRELEKYVGKKREQVPDSATKSTSFEPFPVYRSNTGFLGQFGEQIVPSVVRFYSEALSYTSLLREYRTTLNQKYIAQSQVQIDALAANQFKELQERLPKLITAARDACEALFEEVGPDLETSDVTLLS